MIGPRKPPEEAHMATLNEVINDRVEGIMPGPYGTWTADQLRVTIWYELDVARTISKFEDVAPEYVEKVRVAPANMRQALIDELAVWMRDNPNQIETLRRPFKGTRQHEIARFDEIVVPAMEKAGLAA